MSATATATKETNIPGVLAVMVTIMVALAALTPYLVIIPQQNLNLITQAQTTLWNGWLLILGFYFGTTTSQRKKDETIATMAQTAQVAGTALSPSSAEAIPIAPGEVKKVVGTEDKTEDKTGDTNE